MRKLLSSVAIAALLCAVTSVVQAGTFVPADSLINFQLSGLAASEVYALPGTEGQVSLVDNGMGGHDLVIGSTVWSTINFGSGSSLYTGVPVISNIKITMKNGAASFQTGFSYTNFVGDGTVKGPVMGGVSPLQGSLVVWAFQNPALAVDMGLLGGSPGVIDFPDLAGIPMTVTGGPWVTGPLTMTGVTTNIISVNGVTGVGITVQPPSGAVIRTLSTNGGFVSTGGGLPLEAQTITLSGSNNLLSASQSGTVTLVAPIRVNTTPSVSGRIPLGARMSLSFVPEPGTMLLLVAGAVGLVVVGRRRMRR